MKKISINKDLLNNTLKFFKKYKIVFICLICAALFLMGLVRDIKNKKDNDIENNNNFIIDNTYQDKINIKIIGGVNKDYNGQIEKGLYLFEIIEKYCNGLTDKAIIDNINLVQKIDKDFDLIIKESETINDNKIYIEDYSYNKNKEYRYNGRIKDKIIIYIVNEGISEEDYKIITKITDEDNPSITSGLININVATIEELIEVGFGKSKSEKLIEYRNQNGKFNSIEEILNVNGIGQATLDKVKDKICAN